MPFKSRIVHVRWSGEGVWAPLGDMDFGVGFENNTCYPAPGQIILYPGGVSETELLLAYGPVSFASKAGPLSGNLFITLTSGLENLYTLGRKTLMEGAQDVAVRTRRLSGGEPMPRYAANLSTLFGELPFLDRFKAAREAGFLAVECQFPYAFARDAIAEKLAENGLELVLFNLPAGDFEAGERGLAAWPGREAEFRDGCLKALDWAKALGCGQVNCLVGAPPPEADAKSVRRTMVENVRFAARQAEREGVRLLLEPLNRFDAPRFALHGSADTLALIEETGEAQCLAAI